MLLGHAKWDIAAADESAAAALAAEVGVSPLAAKLLIARGVQSAEEAHTFLNGGIDGFRDPFLLSGMRLAAERISQAVGSGERIRVYGDYDADGVSSTALMHKLLSGLGAQFDTYIPHRMREGYGLNKEAVELAKRDGVSLIVTVDTGVSAVEEVAYIRELGMDVIVTDHHEPPAVLPEPYALVNPKLPNCPYPFKGLAGVGVALKLAHALLGRLPEELLEFAAIGTVADLMPLRDENRLIVKLGLERLRTTKSAGLRALLRVSGVERRDVTAGHIGFSLGPRLNASGRLESAEAALRLLTTDDESEAEALAETLDELNKERQRLVDELTEEACAQVETLRMPMAEGRNAGGTGQAEAAAASADAVESGAGQAEAAAASADAVEGGKAHDGNDDVGVSDASSAGGAGAASDASSVSGAGGASTARGGASYGPDGLPRVLVLAAEGWNPGVVGIAASRIVERYYRPTLVLGIDPDTGVAKGSARSVAGFDIYEALASCGALFDHFGGHAAAAGMSLPRERLSELAARLNGYAAQRLTDDLLVPVQQADLECTLADVSVAVIDELEKLAPFGMANKTPRVVIRDLELTDIRTMGKMNQHLKLGLSQGSGDGAAGASIEAVGFSKGGLSPWMTVGAAADVLAELSVNEWNGVRKPQLILRDVRIPHVQLFDWRGAARAPEKLAALRAAADAAPPQAGAVPGVLLFAAGDAQADSSTWRAPAETAARSGLPAWLYAGGNAVTAANALAESSAFHSVTDVVFYNLPRQLNDLRQVVVRFASLRRCYALFEDAGPHAGRLAPSREQFKGLFGALRSLGHWDASQLDDVRLSIARRLRVSETTVAAMLDVFEQLGFTERNGEKMRLASNPGKRDLSESTIYRDLLGAEEAERLCLYTSAKDLERWLRSGE